MATPVTAGLTRCMRAVRLVVLRSLLVAFGLVSGAALVWLGASVLAPGSATASVTNSSITSVAHVSQILPTKGDSGGKGGKSKGDSGGKAKSDSGERKHESSGRGHGSDGERSANSKRERRESGQRDDRGSEGSRNVRASSRDTGGSDADAQPDGARRAARGAVAAFVGSGGQDRGGWSSLGGRSEKGVGAGGEQVERVGGVADPDAGRARVVSVVRIDSVVRRGVAQTHPVASVDAAAGVVRAELATGLNDAGLNESGSNRSGLAKDRRAVAAAVGVGDRAQRGGADAVGVGARLSGPRGLPASGRVGSAREVDRFVDATVRRVLARAPRAADVDAEGARLEQRLHSQLSAQLDPVGLAEAAGRASETKLSGLRGLGQGRALRAQMSTAGGNNERGLSGAERARAYLPGLSGWASTRKAPGRDSGRAVHAVVSGAVELAGGIAAAVGGERVGRQVRQALSGVAEVVRSALDTGMGVAGERGLDNLAGLVPLRAATGDGSSLAGGGGIGGASGGAPMAKAIAHAIVARVRGCGGGSGCGGDSRGLSSGELSSVGARGPPVRWGKDGSVRDRLELTDRVLDGLVAIASGGKALAGEKNNVEAGTGLLGIPRTVLRELSKARPSGGVDAEALRSALSGEVLGEVRRVLSGELPEGATEAAVRQALSGQLSGQDARGGTAGLTGRGRGQGLRGRLQMLVSDRLAEVGVAVADPRGLPADQVRDRLSAAGVSEMQLRKLVENQLRDELSATSQDRVAGLSDKQPRRLAKARLSTSDLAEFGSTGRTRWGLAAARKAAARAGVDLGELTGGRLSDRVSGRLSDRLSGRGADQLVSGAMDKASNVAAAVGGGKLSKRVRSALSGIADTVRDAVAVAIRASGHRGRDGLGGLFPDQGGLRPGRGDGSNLLGGRGGLNGTGSGGSIKSVAARIVRDVLSGGAGDGAQARTAGLSTQQWSGLGSRGPPPLLGAHTSHDSSFASWWGGSSDSQKTTDEVLNGRLDVIKGEKNLAEERKRLAAGKLDQATYDQHVKDQRELSKRVDVQAVELTDESNALINDTIAGHQKLADGQAKLAAENKQVAAGTLDQATYDQHAAQLNAQREQVYAQTEQLRDATGRDAPPQARAARDGAGASCSSSGAFGECSTTATDSKTGQRSSDRSMCLSGIDGCSSSSGSADRTASASCTAEGCATSTKAGDKTAAARCGVGECNTEAVADSRGADASCQARNGCDSTSSTPTKPDAADLALTNTAGKTAGQAAGIGSCSKDCALATSATESQASADCQTSNGGCDSSSTGLRANENTPTTNATAADTTTTTAAEKTKANREASSKAHCQASAGGCDTTASVRLTRGSDGRRGWFTHHTDYQSANGSPKASAGAHCASGASGCSGHTESSTGGKTQRSTTTPATATVATDPGTRQQAAATPAPSTARTNTTERVHSGTATCTVSAGGCDTTSSGDEESGAASQARVDCDSAACTGKGANTTTASTTATGANNPDARPATRTTTGSSNCEATAGGCQSNAISRADADQRGGIDSATRRGWLRTAAEQTTQTGAGLSAHSEASATVTCDSAACQGAANSSTTGQASGDITGIRDSKGSSTCEAHGAGGGCGTTSDTEVSDRTAHTTTPSTNPDGTAAVGVQPVSGPVSVSHADARVECANGPDCAAKASSETSALDTGVSPHRRGSSASADCAVKGGGCSGQTMSSTSSAPEFVQTDPATGKPVAGAPTSGPSSTSTSSASVDCRTSTCSGTVNTSSAAWDGAIDGGRPRISNGTASCTAGGGTCQMQSQSAASTGPGAARNFAADAQANAARQAAGPSAASVAGAALNCDGASTCTGTATSAATATDRSVSPDPHGSHSQGSCENATGSCQAVSNSGASSGPDANSMAPLVAAQSTDNATLTQATTGDQQQAPPDQQPQRQPGQNQPGTPAAPTAPGSSANSAGPTVPGASSWTMASATLNCSGSSGCSGTTRTSAAGSDGPTAQGGAGGARGPPAGASTTSASCTTAQSACQAQSNSSAGAGQVVADVIAESQNQNAEQAATQAELAQQQAIDAKQAAADAARIAAKPGATIAQRTTATEAKVAADAATQAGEVSKVATELAAKPVENAPATLAQSNATARCAGPGCQAETTGDTATVSPTGQITRSHTAANCAATANGCAVGSHAMVSTAADSGMLDEAGKKTRPGWSAEAQASSTMVCPEAGCTGSLNGTANTAAGKDLTSDSDSSATCDGSGRCQAQLVTATSMAHAPETKNAPKATSAGSFASADCVTGAGGCATKANTRSTAPGNNGSATCAGPGTCEADSAVMSTGGMPQVLAGCQGAQGCKAEASGKAETAHVSGATFDTACSSGSAQRCDVGGQAFAEGGTALAAALCSGPQCRHSFESHSAQSSAHPGQRAKANADCSGGGGAGAAWCATTAQAETGPSHAAAGASCAGSEGVSCSRSHSASSSASAPGARASASGSESARGQGGGFVMTTAHTQSGNGSASAGASCVGAANCRYSYSATASDSASYHDGTHSSSALAHAHGSGGGRGSGGGGVSVYAQATAGKGYAQAATGCSGTSNCSASYSTRADAAKTVGGNNANAHSRCSGGGPSGGSCVTAAEAHYDEKTGKVEATSFCDTQGGSCGKSEAHLTGKASGPGMAKPGGAPLGELNSNGRADCVKTSGSCSVVGVFKYHEASWKKDEHGNKIPVPAYVIGASSCYPQGSHCRQQAHSTGNAAAKDADHKHTGNAVTDCSGTSGMCSTAASASYDPHTGQVLAAADCGAQGAAACTRSKTHTEAWAKSPDGTLTGTGKSDCAQPGGSCSSVSLAKYYPATTQKDARGNEVLGQDGKAIPVPAHMEAGAGCATDGPASGCSYSFSPKGKDEATADDGKLNANASADCSGSGSTGNGWCSVAADASVDKDNRLADAQVWCQGSDGVSCSYSGHADAGYKADKNNASSVKDCGKDARGACSLGVGAATAGGDDEHQGIAAAAGFCNDSNGTCRGEFRTHVDSNRDTLSDCHSAGNGVCNGEAKPNGAESWGQSTKTLHLHSKAPGEEFDKACTPTSGGCGTKTVDGKNYLSLRANTHKSAGGFFKNLVRDGGAVIVNAPAGIVHLVVSIPIELYNTATYDKFHIYHYPKRTNGMTALEQYSTVHPFTGGLAQSTVNFYDRWIKDRWLPNGGSSEKLGNDYYYAPVSTLLEDVGTVALVAYGTGAIIKGISLAGKGAGVAASNVTATTGLRAALVRAGSWTGRRLPRAPPLDAAASAQGVATQGLSKAAVLPKALTIRKNAEPGVNVYRGIRNDKAVYTGITNDLKRRAAQHRARFHDLDRLTPSSVTRGEARAIEQAMIVRDRGENVYNSISPRHPWYQQAVDWGEQWLQRKGL